MSELSLDARGPNQWLCYVELLGPMRIHRDNQVVTQFATQKGAGLLAYLALHPGAHPRERLIDLFWPDLDLQAGRNNLSTTLVSLRRQVEPVGVRRGSVLVTTHAEVGLNPEAVTTDVAVFDGLLQRAMRADTPAKRAELLQRAVALYRGPLLPGHYQDWVVREAERLQVRLQEALEPLAEDLEAMGDLPGALEAARRLCAHDPYSEESHCRLIRLYAQTGKMALAKEAHKRFEQLCADEFGAPPSAATRQVLAQIFAQAPAAPRRPNAPLPEALPVVPAREPAPVTAAPTSSHPPLPVVLTRFFGRAAELDQLGRLLLPRKETPMGTDGLEPPCRLVTLVGPGGIGKTRLVVEFARQAAARFACWCGFISLADLTDARQIEAAMMQALKLTIDPNMPPLERVIALLQQQDRPDAPTLLILDNLEHLLANEETPQPCPVMELVQTLLERVPGLSIVCTSRRRLGLRGEHLLPLDPLPVPEVPTGVVEADELAHLLTAPSVRLYMDRAQAVRPDFGLTPTNAPAVTALCRQLDGSPLALELAAAWVRSLPPRKMWERLTQGMDIPVGSYADLPSRHKMLSAALDWSFRLLTPAQQRLFARLSVFQGGWTAEAAETVCEEPEALILLGQLQEASLVTVTEEKEGEPRYRFLETVRAYSRQRLKEQEPLEMAQSRHAACFLALMEQARQGMRGQEISVWLDRLEAEQENLRAALQWFHQTPERAEEELQMASGLIRYWQTRGSMVEGLEYLQTALARPEAQAPTATRAQALNAAGVLAHRLSDYKLARTRQQEALALWAQLGDRRSLAGSLHNLANVLSIQGDYREAQALYLRARTINQEMGNRAWETMNLGGLGDVLAKQGAFDEAMGRFDQGVDLARQVGDLYAVANNLINQARVYLQMDRIAEAHQRAEQALGVAREIGHRGQEPYIYFCLGEIARRQGDLASAETWLRQALQSAHQQNNLREVVTTLECLAPLRASQGASVQAACLYGFAARILQTLRSSRDPAEQDDYDRHLASARALLSEQKFTAAWTVGERMSLEEGIAYALGETIRPAGEYV